MDARLDRLPGAKGAALRTEQSLALCTAAVSAFLMFGFMDKYTCTSCYLLVILSKTVHDYKRILNIFSTAGNGRQEILLFFEKGFRLAYQKQLVYNPSSD